MLAASAILHYMFIGLSFLQKACCATDLCSFTLHPVTICCDCINVINIIVLLVTEFVLHFKKTCFNTACVFVVYITHCVPRAPVREVSSHLDLFTYWFNTYNTMHFIRFGNCRNVAFKLS